MSASVNTSIFVPKERTRKQEEYIKNKVNGLSSYNVYWCLFELRLQGRLKDHTHKILKNDALCKLQLIKILKQEQYRTDGINVDTLLETIAENNIPFSYVKWFYNDKRAALWMKIVLEKYNFTSETIFIESDITIFVHDIIFNRPLNIIGRKICELLGQEADNGESLIFYKVMVFEYLKKAYIFSKIDSKGKKWFIGRDSDAVNYAYQYMQEPRDLDNLYLNKKNNVRLNKNADKTRLRKPLICADIINFDESNTTSRHDHMLASLDYWMFDNYWFSTHNIAIVHINNRTTFVENMYDAWNAKQKRDRDKNKKEQGIDLTNDNKKNLKYLAKACGKTQREVLNDLVESASSQILKQEIQLSSPFPIQNAFFANIAQAQTSSLQTEDSEKKVVSEDTLLTKKKQESSSEYDAESVGSSTYDNEEVPAETITSKKEVQPFQVFYSQESDTKPAEDTADTNTDRYYNV